MLRTHGLRTGLYTSPHLCTFRERIQIDGVPIGERALLDAAERLWPAVIAEGASFFEATTAIGLLAFANAEIDIAVIEVGLGGRLDSTNVITPLVTVVTNVSLDHVQLLGATIEAVATEKAGILKAGVPAITGESAGPAAEVLHATSEARAVPLRTLAATAVTVESMTLEGTTFRTHTDAWGVQTFRTPLIGSHQAWNAALAVAAAELLPPPFRPSMEDVRDGIASVAWPGRMQVERIAGRTWIFDVAHNVAGVNALLAALDEIDPPHPRTVLVGVLGDKDWVGMLAPVAAWADRLIITAPPTAPADRRWDLEAVAAALQSARAETIGDFADALRACASPGPGRTQPPAVAPAGDEGGTIVVTGSFHTVGDALAMLGRCSTGSDVALPEVVFGG
jgi:dihydrofolate synthase / folylpolyglutamate synthase